MYISRPCNLPSMCSEHVKQQGPSARPVIRQLTCVPSNRGPDATEKKLEREFGIAWMSGLGHRKMLQVPGTVSS